MRFALDRRKGVHANMNPPLRGRYIPTLAIALAALIPYILVVGGSTLFRPQVVSDLGSSQGAISIISGLATAGYAFGALLGGDIVQRFHQRRLFLIWQIVLIAVWVISAEAPDAAVYGIGRVAAGFATGLQLVTALPLTVRQFPPTRTPLTAAFIDIAFFGGVAAGPLICGLVADGHAWRIFFAALAGLSALDWLLAFFTLPWREPFNPNLRLDWTGLALGFGATFLPFAASGALSAAGFASFLFTVLMAIGIACRSFDRRICQGRAACTCEKDGLSFPHRRHRDRNVRRQCLRQLRGTRVTVHAARRAPFPACGRLSLCPQIAGVVVSATLLGLLFSTRFLPVLAFGGMLLVIAGGALLAAHGAKPDVWLGVSGLLGVGAGHCLARPVHGKLVPALATHWADFRACRACQVGADFMLAPVMTQVAHVLSGGTKLKAAAIQDATWITLAIPVLALIAVAAIFLRAGAPLPRPNLKAWIEENKPGNTVAAAIFYTSGKAFPGVKSFIRTRISTPRS